MILTLTGRRSLNGICVVFNPFSLQLKKQLNLVEVVFGVEKAQPREREREWQKGPGAGKRSWKLEGSGG